jgi:hypothetical protein
MVCKVRARQWPKLASHSVVGQPGISTVLLFAGCAGVVVGAFTGCVGVVFDTTAVPTWVVIVPADPEAPGCLDGVPDQAGGREEVSALLTWLAASCIFALVHAS